MIADLKPYPAMKDSGVKWLGKVPEHWEVFPFSAIAKPKSITGHHDRELLSVYLDRGVIRFSDAEEKRTNVTSEDLSKYQGVDPGDFVLNNQQAWRGSVGVSRHTGIVSPAYLVLSLDSRIQPDFANLLLREKIMVSQYLICSKGVGSIQRNLYWPHLKRVSAFLPPISEQTAIVRFLDHFDRRIRRYIRAKQKLIRLLEEQKQAIIHRAVTRGLDPNVQLKDSGFEWLGKVPEHWEVRRLKTLCTMKSGDGITAFLIESSGDFPVYGGNGIRGYTTGFTHDGDFVLIGRQGALCGNVHIARGRFWASEHAVVASLKANNSLEWFASLLEAMNLNQYSIAAAQPGLAVERILNLWVPVPLSEEQVKIGADIAESTVNIDIAIARAKREIELFNEYRTRLIADLVTGKLDVREAAARLPDEPEEPEPPDEVDAMIDAEEEPGDDLDPTLEEVEA